MSDEKEFINAALVWGSFMTMLTGFIGFISGKQTDKKISDYDEKRQAEEKEEESETITILRSLQEQITEMDKNTAITHTRIEEKVEQTIVGVGECKKKITDLYKEKEELGNRITAIEARNV